MVPIIARLKGRAAAITCVALLVVVAIDHTIVGQEQQRVSGWGALLRAWPEFMVGILVYRFYSEGHFRRVGGAMPRSSPYSRRLPSLVSRTPPDGVIVVLLVPLLLASVGNSGRTTGMLNARPLRWLGDISYSVYIFQMTAFAIPVTFAGVLVASGWGGYRFQAITILTAIGCGALVHRCIDVPMRVALRGLLNRVIGSATFRPRRRAALSTALPAVSANDLWTEAVRSAPSGREEGHPELDGKMRGGMRGHRGGETAPTINDAPNDRRREVQRQLSGDEEGGQRCS